MHSLIFAANGGNEIQNQGQRMDERRLSRRRWVDEDLRYALLYIEGTKRDGKDLALTRVT